MMDTPASRATSLNVARAGFLRDRSDSRCPFIDDSLRLPFARSLHPTRQQKRHSLIYLLRDGCTNSSPPAATVPFIAGGRVDSLVNLQAQNRAATRIGM